MTTNPLDKFAPYPRSEDEVTADALARHVAVSAQRRRVIIDRLMVDTSPDAGARRMDQIGVLINEYGVVKLLRALVEHAPEEADGYAKRLWGAWHDGASVDEGLWEWLTEYGIDPEAVSRVAGEMWDRHQSDWDTEVVS